MFVNLLGSGQSTTWVEFYDKGIEINEYGEKVFGSSLVGSALCVVIPDDVVMKRTENGVIRVNDVYVHFPASMDVEPERTLVRIDGTAYNMLYIYDGAGITGTRYARLMEIVG